LATSEALKHPAPDLTSSTRALFVAVVSLFLFLNSSILNAAQFKACEDSARVAKAPSELAPAGIRPRDVSCHQSDEIGLLRSTGLIVSTRLETTLQNLKDSVGLQDELEKAVLNHLGTSLEKYEHLGSCDSRCSPEMSPMLLKTAPEISQLRLEMSLMQPEEVGTNAIETDRGWFSTVPRHPFAKSPSVPSLSEGERNSIRDEFLKRLAEKLPFIAARLPSIKARKSVLGETAVERGQIAQALVQIQNEARQNYLKAIGRNPLLIFLEQNDPDLPTSTRDLAAASQYLANEIRAESARLKGLPASPEKSQAFIEYQPLVEATLRRHPEYCTAALNVANAAESHRTNMRIGLVAGQVAAGFATFVLCSTVVSCGFAAAVLSAADFGVASHEAKVAFRQGLATTVTSERHSDTSELMANADSAARLQGLALTLGAPTVLKSGGELLRATSTFLRSSAKGARVVAATSVTQSRELTGLSTAKQTASNPIFRAVYSGIVNEHSGREREIIEELIRRYEAKGLNPVEISTTIRQRVNQCVH
jgi:hypothetical protein